MLAGTLSQEDMSFSCIGTNYLNAEFYSSRILELFNYLENFKEHDKVFDYIFFALSGRTVYLINLKGVEYVGVKNGNNYSILNKNELIKTQTIDYKDVSKSERLFNVFYGVSQSRLNTFSKISNDSLSRRLDSSSKLKMIWQTQINTKLTDIWISIKERFTKMFELSREFDGMTVAPVDDKFTPITPDYSTSFSADWGSMNALIARELGMPKGFFAGALNEQEILYILNTKVKSVCKILGINFKVDKTLMVAYISTTSLEREES